jgi:D-beta-D-heptose 7-phosphate kinase/D-beta-D-heptose 1-phosphate adenosyltransferase
MHKIIVLGDYFLDQYISGPCNRISPERPVPIIEYQNKSTNLGGAGNVVANLKNIGANVIPMGFLGKDYISEKIISLVEELKIKKTFFHRSSKIEGISKTRIISNQQQIVRIDREKDFFEHSKKFQNYIYKSFLKITKHNNIKFLLVSDYGKGTVSPELLRKLIYFSNKKKISVIIDPSKKKNNIEIYSNAFVITPNFNELKLIEPNINNNDDEIVKTAKEIIHKYNIKYILVTRSEKGATLVSKSKFYHLRTVQKKVYDVSGAGDTIISVLVHLLNKKIDILHSAKIANLCAGHVVGLANTKPILKKDFLMYKKEII